MRDLSNETDVGILQNAVRLMQKELERLVAEVAQLRRENAKLKGQSAKQAQLRLAELEARVQALQNMLFGSSSEKRADEDAPEKPKKANRGHGRREQPDLEVVDVVHELDEADRACTACGERLEPWEGQFETSEEIDVIPRRYVLKRHLRQKYRCACGGCVETAPCPEKLVAGGRYSIELAVDVAVHKYLDHQPLERQVRAMARDGLVVESQTLFDLVDLVAKHGKAAYEQIGARARAAPVAGADETRWPVYGKGQAAKPSKWHAWLLGTDDVVYFEVHDTRGLDAAKSLLGGFSGTLVTDEYGVYRSVGKTLGIRIAHCWAHVRREYLALEKAFPREIEWMLFWMRWMWAVESHAKRADGSVDLGLLAQLRGTYSRAATEQIAQLAKSILAAHEPASGIAVAARTMLDAWPSLVAFLDDARVPIDNNASERALRGMVVGRKNHYGSRSRRGSEVAAVLYSLLETAKLVGVDPRVYLRAVVLASVRGEPAPLPHELVRA